METIIQKAIEGGYDLKSKGYSDDTVKLDGYRVEDDWKVFIWVKQSWEDAEKQGYRHSRDGKAWMHASQLMIDPLFWQALGKACTETVWDFVGEYNYSDFPNQPSGKKYGEYQKVLDWKKIALRFHEINLTEGWNKAVSYLTSITTNRYGKYKNNKHN